MIGFKVMKKLTLSIVIPVYNEQDYIVSCLQSIARQTELPDEVIVVDNNCSDNTVDLARKFAFVTVVQAKRQGIVHARNRGFNAARGDIIGRIDADTVLEPDWVETVKAYFTARPAAGAITGNCYFYDFPATKATQFIHHLTYYSVQKLLAGTDVLWGSNMALRRTDWRKIKNRCNQGADVHEDIDLTLHMKSAEMSIERLAGLQAGVSMRRGDLTPDSVISYLTPWPKTYWASGRYGAAIGVSFLFVWVLFWVIPVLYARAGVSRLLAELRV